MKKHLIIAWILFVLTGCATYRSSPGLPTITGTPTEWLLKGNFAVKTPVQQATSRINWQQRDREYDINLYTLFGISIMSIEGNDQGVRIDGKAIPGHTPEQVLQHMTGWQLPINNLKDWLMGRVQRATQASYDPQGNFSQGMLYDNQGQPWQLTLSKYKPVQGRLLPHKVSLQQDEIKLKLAISSWQITR